MILEIKAGFIKKKKQLVIDETYRTVCAWHIVGVSKYIAI